jgi:hypothetical protein
MVFKDLIEDSIKEKLSLKAYFRSICKDWKIRDTIETFEDQIGVISGSIARILKDES